MYYYNIIKRYPQYTRMFVAAPPRVHQGGPPLALGPPPLRRSTPCPTLRHATGRHHRRDPLKALPRGSAAGPSGLTYEHIHVRLLGLHGRFGGPLQDVGSVHDFLQGGPELTVQALHALLTLPGPFGLPPQLDKCAVYSADARAAASIPGQLGMHHAPDGLLAAGTPVGTPAFQEAHADRCVAHACHLMEDLEALPLAHPDRWLLLHSSLQGRVAHLPHGCLWTHVKAAVQRVSRGKAVNSAFATLGLPRVARLVTAQMTLPLCHDDLGLHRTSPAEGSATYLATAATAHKAMLNGPDAFRPFDGPSGVQLLTQFPYMAGLALCGCQSTRR
jgi:hypothetical protein